MDEVNVYYFIHDLINILNAVYYKKSKKNPENRKKTSGKHRCGTKTLAIKVDKEVRVFSFF